MTWNVLNLYAGIGGNRKLWEDVDVTAVELHSGIASVYRKFNPDDRMIVGDAEEYLVEHYDQFDFIWASPPCNTHSSLRKAIAENGGLKPVLPDLSLYSLIIFLDGYADCKWCVENVEPYYEPLVEPAVKLDRHLFWSNFMIPPKRFTSPRTVIRDVTSRTKRYGFNLEHIETGRRKDQILRNLVNPDIGKYILECARANTQQTLTQISQEVSQ